MEQDAIKFVGEHFGLGWAVAVLFASLWFRDRWRQLRRDGLKLEIKAHVPRRTDFTKRAQR